MYIQEIYHMQKLLILLSIVLALILTGCSFSSGFSAEELITDEEALWSEAMKLELAELADEEEIDQDRSVFTNNDSYTVYGYWAALKAGTCRQAADRMIWRRQARGWNQGIVISNDTAIYDTASADDDLVRGGNTSVSTEEYSAHGGNNWINGKGGIDVVYFDRPREEYTIRNWGGIHLTVVYDGNDSTYSEVTRLTGIEKLVFSDDEFLVRYFSDVDNDGEFEWTGEGIFEWYETDPSTISSEERYSNYILLGYGDAESGTLDFRGWSGDDILFGGRGDDAIYGGDTTRNILYGNRGDDYLYPNGWEGQAFVHGGSGTDTVVLRNAFADMTITVYPRSSTNRRTYVTFSADGEEAIVTGVEKFLFRYNPTISDQSGDTVTWKEQVYKLAKVNGVLQLVLQ
jgi:hypothetical protein